MYRAAYLQIHAIICNDMFQCFENVISSVNLYNRNFFLQVKNVRISTRIFLGINHSYDKLAINGIIPVAK